jgi:hypothetical protein
MRTGLTSQVTGRRTSQVTTSHWNASTLVGDSMLEPQDLVV